VRPKGFAEVAGQVLDQLRDRAVANVDQLRDRTVPRSSKRGSGAFASRFARRLAKRSRRNWRHNGLRPRGRGYDWARTLIAERILELASLAQLEEDPGADTDAAGAAIAVVMGELAAEVGCHERIAQREVARLESVGCLRREIRAGGRGLRGTVLHVCHAALEARVLARLHRNEEAKTGSAPQLALPLKKPVPVPADIQAIVDRMAKLKAARDAQKNLVQKGDPSSPLILPTNPETAPSALPSVASEGALRGRETKISKFAGPPDLKTLGLDWRACQAIDRGAKGMLSEPLRRRLNRHLRLCCWYRGLDKRATRRVTGAVGWTAVAIGKASKRKYFLLDAIGWVMASKPDELREATASWHRMLGRARAGFGRRNEPASVHRRSRAS